METFMKLIALVSGLFFVSGNAIAEVKTCQTAAEIKAHVETSEPEEFCFHKVVNPAIGLYYGRAIPSFYQLMPNREVAFLNTKKNFDEAQASCAGRGAGWHAPASSSSDPGATPRANDNSNSLEGVGSYFKATVDQYFWSSSSFSYNTYGAWYVSLSTGSAYYNDKYDSYNVVCVRP